MLFLLMFMGIGVAGAAVGGGSSKPEEQAEDLSAAPEPQIVEPDPDPEPEVEETEDTVDHGDAGHDAGHDDHAADDLNTDNHNTGDAAEDTTGSFTARYYALDAAVQSLSQVDFDATPLKTEELDSVDFADSLDPFWEDGREDLFAAQIVAMLTIQQAGHYTFFVTSDDGSMLSIDGAVVADNDTPHATETEAVTLFLEAGTHPIKLEYFENYGFQGLQLEWSGPDTHGARILLDGTALTQGSGDHQDHGTDDSTDDTAGHQDHGTDDSTDQDMMDDIAGHDDHGGHDDHADQGGQGGQGGHDTHGDHAGHDEHLMDTPQTAEEIAAFVAAVRAGEETHVHDHGSSKMTEHTAALDLVPREEATHIAIGHGDWNDASNWHTGEVPGEGAKALIPDGIHMTYGAVNEASLFTLRVDGHLQFDDDTDSRLVLDTMVVSPDGRLTIGTEENPIQQGVDVEIIFANNGPIDTDWDPMLLSRGLISHGEAEIHGAAKDSHEKVIEDPMTGDTSIRFAEIPEGWEVGDTIVIAGTHYEGYYNWDPSVGYIPPEDEERVITHIEGDRVFFDDALIHDHDAPRDDLKTSVANYSRNVSFETENAEDAEVYERGHVMFMHNDDVDVRYAEFHELGRTDKSDSAQDASAFDQIAFDDNAKGRYSLHIHRAGTEDQDNPAILEGNAVYGSPGWGIVHHDSHAILQNNATYDTFGAGYVAESGNETGAWTDNIAIFAQGISWQDPKAGPWVKEFDLGKTGDGFWFQGRMVESTDNIAASVHNGFVYFHRGPDGEGGNLWYDTDLSPIEQALYYDESIGPGKHPILGFDGNEAFAAKAGLHVVKANQNQGHDVHSVLTDFTAWSVREGADLAYTGHYLLSDFDLVSREDSEDLLRTGGASVGIKLGTNAHDITVVDSSFEGFKYGVDLNKQFSTKAPDPEQHSFSVINPTFKDVETQYKNYDPTLDTILDTEDLPLLTPDIMLDGPLTYKEQDFAGDPEARHVEIIGEKADSLGLTDFGVGTDSFNLNRVNVSDILNEQGYYTTSDGQDFFYLDVFFSDRLNGDIYVEKHAVLVDDNVRLGETNDHLYRDAEFNGIVDFGSAQDQSHDVAKLWAVLTEGQAILAEDMPSVSDVEEDVMDFL